MNQLPYRPNVCMLVRNSKFQLFLGEREGNPGVWQFPQGGVEEGTSLEENVLRELEEELGAKQDLFTIEHQLAHRHQYDFAVIPKYAVGKWRGQSQTFWVVNFNGTDEDLVLDKHSPEFRSFRWVDLSEVATIAEPRRLPGYTGALREYAHLNNLPF